MFDLALGLEYLSRLGLGLSVSVSILELLSLECKPANYYLVCCVRQYIRSAILATAWLLSCSIHSAFAPPFTVCDKALV